jgi:LacI family transcriptional regulator
MGDIVQGAVDVVESEGYGLLLFTCNRGAESMRQFSAQVSGKAFDGLVAIEPEGTLDYLADLYASGLPVVLIDDRGNGPQLPSVATTNRAGGALAARHLWELGRRRPLVITGPEKFGCTQDRLGGFADTFAAAGSPVDPRLVVEGDFTYDAGSRAVKDSLDAGLSFDAVFAHNDLSAAGALQALRHAGRAVPDDVAVVGFDDIAHAAHTEPPLTTIRQPMRQMGETAARRLIAHFDGTPLTRDPAILPATLVVRETTTR